MTCENQTIAEMLVPYVEGALAEAERLEVSEHLRHCPACRDEARRVREGILAVRRLFASGYRPRLARHPAVEELVAFSADPESLSESVRQNLDLHLLECEACATEVSLLGDMRKELEGRVAPGASPLLLPRALREEIERVFPGAGTPAVAPQVVESLPWTERLSLLWSRFNWRPALATVGAALLLTLGFLFASSGPQQEVAVKSVTPPSPPASPAATTPAEVALPLSPGQLEQVAPLLDREGVPWQNRSGILYVSSADLQKARSVVESGLSDRRLAETSAPSPSPSPTPEVRPEASPLVPTPTPSPTAPARPTPQESPSPRPSAVLAQAPAPAAPQRSALPASTAPVRPAPGPTTARPTALPRLAHADSEEAPAPRIVAMGEAGASARSPGGAVNQDGELSDSAPPTPALEVAASAPEPPAARSAGVAKASDWALESAPTADRAAAVESQARQLVGNASVSVEGAQDGSVHVIVRAHQSLTNQQMEDLRRRLRRDLGLRDSDTITIR